MSDFDTQINVGMNVEGVVTGTEKAKRSLKDLNTSARESGKSIDGMGDGGAKAADKVEAATRSMIGSIQRQTAALDAGDKSSRKYQESLAKMRGVDVNALKPYLDQLDAAKMKQDIALNSQNGLIGGFGGIGTAAIAAGAAFVAAAAGVATMTKKVIDGLDALNDLKDATGASIENISAIEDVALRTGASFDVVSTSLIKLNQGLNSAKPGSDTENAIKAIGLSVNDLKELDPAEAFRQIAIGLSSFADDANKARLTQELFGKSLKEVAPLLNDLAASGELVATVTAKQAEEAEKFNKELAQLSKSSLDAARDMAGPLVSAINEKEAQKAIIKPVLDSRAAIEAQARPAMIAAPVKADPEVLISEAKDPRVLSAFADLRDRMLQNSKAMSRANVQRSLDALAHMQVAMEIVDND